MLGKLPSVGQLSLPEAALAYARAGVPIFPLASKSKRPIYMGGFNQATIEEAQVVQWWADNPQANIGAVPGRVGCIVPDIDTEEAREAWYELVVVDTAATQTGGGIGVHPWYRSDALARRSHWRLDEQGGTFGDPRLANLLFRASGGYVVVAPSIHPDTDQPYTLIDPAVPISDLPSDVEKALLAIPARAAGGGHAVSTAEVEAWFADVSKPETSPGGVTIVEQRILNIANAPKDARNDTLMAEVGVLLNAAYVWDIDLHDAREQVRAAYVPHVADTRKSRDANREVDHAFDYIATQRYWEGPLEEAVGGLPIKPKLEVVPSLPSPKTPEDRHRIIVQELIEGRVQIGPLLRGETPEIEWLVDGIIPRGRLVAVVAEAKAGKSLLLLDIGAGLAVGHAILGKAHGPLVVLYVDYEMTPDDLHGRLDDLGYKEDEATAALLDQNLHYWQIPPIDPLDTEAGGRLLVDAAAAIGADLIVVDTLAAAVQGAENESDTYRAARHYTWAPLKAAGRTVIRVDHLGKDKSKGARGSSMKRDDVDVLWELSRAGTDDKLVLVRTHSRLPGVEERINLARLTNPLRHVRQGRRKYATTAVALARAMLDAGVALDGPGRLADRARRAGIIFDQRNLTEARAYIAAGMPDLGPDMESDIIDPRAVVVAPSPPTHPSPPPRGKRKVGGIESLEVT